MGVDVSVEGMDVLVKALNDFPARVQKNILTSAVRAGATLVAKEARLRAPKDSGQMAKSIGVVKRRSKNKSEIHFAVTPRKNRPHAFIAKFHEFGTSKMPAHPFMRPAAETKAEEVIESVKKKMRQRIDKEIEKSGK